MPRENIQPGGPYVLRLPEIQLRVFQELAAKDLLSAALVCKAWSWLAIDTAWRSCYIQLSWLLAPLLDRTSAALRKCRKPGLLHASIERWDSQLAEKITRLVIDLT
ncbi:hypothetical protein FRB95_008549 [Tulasnella sp. JGI-2019a]|nr:hypothetical protein FRB95_008549 [Tulasnella sp. JGI-2019a]